jgi:hypothetical protein
VQLDILDKRKTRYRGSHVLVSVGNKRMDVQVCYLDLGRELTLHEDGGMRPLCIPVENVDPV